MGRVSLFVVQYHVPGVQGVENKQDREHMNIGVGLNEVVASGIVRLVQDRRHGINTQASDGERLDVEKGSDEKEICGWQLVAV